MPTSPLSFLVFVFIVAPGLWAELILQRTKTRPKESAFIEVGRVLLASTAISLPAFGLAFVVWPIGDHGSWPNMTMLIKGDAAYIGDKFGPLILSAAAYEVFSLSLAAPLFAMIVDSFDRRFTGRISDRYTAWSFAFDHPKQKGKPAARIRMPSGAVWAGPVATYTPNHEMVDRELILKAPIFHQSAGSPELELTENEVVVLKASDIEIIEVEYYGSPDAQSGEASSQSAGAVTAADGGA